MANQSASIAQEEAIEEFKEAAEDLKLKAKAAGAAAWNVTKASYQQLQNKTRNCSQATDRAIRSSPYISLSIAFGIGMLLGAFATRRKIAVEKKG